MQKISGAREIIREACEDLARPRLRARIPAAQRAVSSAGKRLAEVKGRAKTVEASLRKTEADLSEARAQLAACAVNDDDELEARTAARVQGAALAEEAESLTLKLERVRQVAAPHLAARAEAEAALARAKTELATLTEAIDEPFTAKAGREDAAFEMYVRCGGWEDYPDSDAARRVLVDALKETGLYAELIREAVTKWLAGDMEVRKLSRVLRDDDQVHLELLPDGTPVAFDVRGRSRERFAGQHAAAPEQAPSMGEIAQGAYGGLLARPQR